MNKLVKTLFPILLAFISVLFIFFGINQFGFWDSSKGPLGGFYPTIIATVLLVMSIWEIISSRKRENPSFKIQEWSIVLAICLVFLFSFIIGMIPSIFCFLLFWIHFVVKKRWRFCLVFSLIVTVVIYLVFGLWLGIMFPWGLLSGVIG